MLKVLAQIPATISSFQWPRIIQYLGCLRDSLARGTDSTLFRSPWIANLSSLVPTWSFWRLLTRCDGAVSLLLIWLYHHPLKEGTLLFLSFIYKLQLSSLVNVETVPHCGFSTSTTVNKHVLTWLGGGGGWRSKRFPVIVAQHGWYSAGTSWHYA